MGWLVGEWPFGREMLVHLQNMIYYHQNCGPFAMSCLSMPICSCLYTTLSSFVSAYNPTIFYVILPIISRKNSASPISWCQSAQSLPTLLASPQVINPSILTYQCGPHVAFHLRISGIMYSKQTHQWFKLWHWSEAAAFAWREAMDFNTESIRISGMILQGYTYHCI